MTSYGPHCGFDTGNWLWQIFSISISEDEMLSSTDTDDRRARFYIRSLNQELSTVLLVQSESIKQIWCVCVYVCVCGCVYVCACLRLGQTAHDLQHQLLLPVFGTNGRSSSSQPGCQSRRVQPGQLARENEGKGEMEWGAHVKKVGGEEGGREGGREEKWQIERGRATKRDTEKEIKQMYQEE